MEPRLKYVSQYADPYLEDNLLTNAVLIDKGYEEYKCDTIINSIGTEDCQQNIQLFLQEIEEYLDDDALQSFYFYALDKMIEVYHMDILVPYRDNHRLENYNKNSKDFLLFFEKDYLEFMLKVLDIVEDPEIIRKPEEFSKYVLYRNSIFRQKISDIIKKRRSEGNPLPLMASYFFINSSRSDMCYCIVKMTLKDSTTIINNLYLLKGGLKDVRD